MNPRRGPTDPGQLPPVGQLPASRPLDEMDRAIIRMLQHDGRLPFREIARQLGVAEGTVRLRANRLARSGALTIVAIADPFRLGYRVLAFSLLKVLPERQQPVIDALIGWDEITSSPPVPAARTFTRSSFAVITTICGNCSTNAYPR